MLAFKSNGTTSCCLGALSGEGYGYGRQLVSKRVMYRCTRWPPNPPERVRLLPPVLGSDTSGSLLLKNYTVDSVDLRHHYALRGMMLCRSIGHEGDG